MMGLLGGDGMVANFHPPKRGPLCLCHFRLSTFGDLSAIRPPHRCTGRTSANLLRTNRRDAFNGAWDLGRRLVYFSASFVGVIDTERLRSVEFPPKPQEDDWPDPPPPAVTVSPAPAGPPETKGEDWQSELTVV